ncbi:MAG TPA: co-chaperone GroES [Actinomycetota bacterium]|nr:co-chaperone GroES [Actinomycetota bacterium]
MPPSKDAKAAIPKEPRKRTSRTKRSATPAAMPSSIELTGDRLVVRVPGNGERKTTAGLLIPATAMPAPKRLAWGDVTLVGPDVRVAKAGDRVLFLPAAGLEVELEGEDLVLLRERDVQAVSTAPAGGKDRAPGQYL